MQVLQAIIQEDLPSGTTVTGDYIDVLDMGRLSEFPSQSMFSAAIANEQHAEGFNCHFEMRVLWCDVLRQKHQDGGQ